MPNKDETFEQYLDRIYPSDVKWKEQKKFDIVESKAIILRNLVFSPIFKNIVNESSFPPNSFIKECNRLSLEVHPDLYANLEEKTRTGNEIQKILNETRSKYREKMKEINFEKQEELAKKQEESVVVEEKQKYDKRENEVRHDANSDVPRVRKVDESDQDYNNYLSEFYDNKTIEAKGFDYINEQYYNIQKQSETLSNIENLIVNLSDEDQKNLKDLYDRYKSSINEMKDTLDEKTALYRKK